jgi:hypothetical protein
MINVFGHFMSLSDLKWTETLIFAVPKAICCSLTAAAGPPTPIARSNESIRLMPTPIAPAESTALM